MPLFILYLIASLNKFICPLPYLQEHLHRCVDWSVDLGPLLLRERSLPGCLAGLYSPLYI